MATIAAPVYDMRLAERRFYTRMALLLTLIVFLGFAPSFYLRDVVPAYPRPNPTLSLSVILHGALFTLWVLVFIAQTQLVAAGRRDLHVKLGTASMALAIALVPAMYLASVWQVARANHPPFASALDWTIVPLAAIPAYIAMLWLGWQRRRDPQWHKRLMLGAAFVVGLGPALGRLPIYPPTLVGFTVVTILALLFFIPLFRWDRRSLGRTHPATRLVFSLYVAATVLPLLFLATGSWAAIARHLPGV